MGRLPHRVSGGAAWEGRPTIGRVQYAGVATTLISDVPMVAQHPLAAGFNERFDVDAATRPDEADTPRGDQPCVSI